MIQTVYRSSAGDLRVGLSLEELREAVDDARGLLWVDLCDEPATSCEPILRDVFKFHPLAVDDALEERHVPRVDDWERYLYLVLQAASFDPSGEEPLVTVELDVFLGHNYVVTYHTRPIDSLKQVWEAYAEGGREGSRQGERPLQRGTGYLLYRLVDALVTQYMPVVEAIDDAIDAVEDQIFYEPTADTLQAIFTLKRTLLRLRRVTGPQRDVLGKLARGDYAVIKVGDRVFFRDVYDHLVRLHEISESMRDLVGSALDTYLSVTSNRMNEVMKVLTVITTLLMPLSFVVGFFGMNFFQPAQPLTAWTSRLMFGVMLAAMLVLPVAMAIWMRRRGWL